MLISFSSFDICILFLLGRCFLDEMSELHGMNRDVKQENLADGSWDVQGAVK